MLYLEPIGTGGSGRLAEHPHGYTVERFAKQLGRFLETLDLFERRSSWSFPRRIRHPATYDRPPGSRIGNDLVLVIGCDGQ